MRASLIWEKMLIEDRRIISSEEIGELSRRVGKEPDRAIDYLQHNGFIIRILRGIYYVKDYEERKKGVLNFSRYEMISMALERKGVNFWYFGLESGLKMNLMTHEYFMVDSIITDSFRTTKVIDIIGGKYRFIKWSHRHFERGILNNGLIRYSDKEKTVLDLVYRDYLDGKKKFISAYSEYADQLSKDKIRIYLSDYPHRFEEAFEGSL